MNIGILGTGIVGRTLAMRLVELSHAVILGTRDPQKTLAETASDLPMHTWLQQNPKVILGTFADAAAHGEIVINATNGNGSLNALRAAGEAKLNSKTLLDISNPLDFSKGMPPTLFVSNTDSLAEQIQREFPNVKVVKTLNTVTASLMVHPRQLANGTHSVFISGNDAAAKAKVSDLLHSFGWEDIIDLGDISTARGVEMYLPIWLRLWGALGTGLLNVRVVR
jgi:8-hydroxy-5-deazaflavin:NADPH oxidoreductase